MKGAVQAIEQHLSLDRVPATPGFPPGGLHGDGDLPVHHIAVLGAEVEAQHVGRAGVVPVSFVELGYGGVVHQGDVQLGPGTPMVVQGQLNRLFNTRFVEITRQALLPADLDGV